MNLIIYIQYAANTFKFVKRQPTTSSRYSILSIKCFVDNRYSKVGNPCTHLTNYKEYHLMGSYFP